MRTIYVEQMGQTIDPYAVISAKKRFPRAPLSRCGTAFDAGDRVLIGGGGTHYGVRLWSLRAAPFGVPLQQIARFDSEHLTKRFEQLAVDVSHSALALHQPIQGGGADPSVRELHHGIAGKAAFVQHFGKA
jgi:hypothetical protein